LRVPFKETLEDDSLIVLRLSSLVFAFGEAKQHFSSLRGSSRLHFVCTIGAS